MGASNGRPEERRRLLEEIENETENNPPTRAESIQQTEETANAVTGTSIHRSLGSGLTTIFNCIFYCFCGITGQLVHLPKICIIPFIRNPCFKFPEWLFLWLMIMLFTMNVGHIITWAMGFDIYIVAKCPFRSCSFVYTIYNEQTINNSTRNNKTFVGILPEGDAEYNDWIKVVITTSTLSALLSYTLMVFILLRQYSILKPIFDNILRVYQLCCCTFCNEVPRSNDNGNAILDPFSDKKPSVLKPKQACYFHAIFYFSLAVLGTTVGLFAVILTNELGRGNRIWELFDVSGLAAQFFAQFCSIISAFIFSKIAYSMSNACNHMVTQFERVNKLEFQQQELTWIYKGEDELSQTLMRSSEYNTPQRLWEAAKESIDCSKLSNILVSLSTEQVEQVNLSESQPESERSGYPSQTGPEELSAHTQSSRTEQSQINSQTEQSQINSQQIVVQADVNPVPDSESDYTSAEEDNVAQPLIIPAALNNYSTVSDSGSEYHSIVSSAEGNGSLSSHTQGRTDSAALTPRPTSAAAINEQIPATPSQAHTATDFDKDKLQLYLLQAVDRYYVQALKATMRPLGIWFVFHWVLYTLTAFMSIAYFIEAIVQQRYDTAKPQCLSESSTWHHVPTACHLHNYYLFFYALEHVILSLYPCFRAAKMTTSRAKLIKKVSLTRWTNISELTKGRFVSHLEAEKANFKISLLCAEISFGPNIAFLSVIIGILGIVIKLAF